MAIEIRMPALSPSMTEGTLARWTKKEGETVAVGDVIAEIETDKALVDFESTESGILGKILVNEGSENVKVGTFLAYILQPGEKAPEEAPGNAATPSAPALVDDLTTVHLQGATAEKTADPTRLFASPLARRLARESGLDLSSITGSGPHGRIVRVDIEMARSSAQQPKAAALSRPSPPAIGESPLGFVEIPHSSVRRVIAQRLTEAKQQIPHFYLTIEVLLDPLLGLRAEANKARGEHKLSVNDFIVKAVGLAMRRVPAVNASWSETAVRRWNSVDVSVAVATPNGLVTPIVRDADTKAVSAISAEIKELAGRARENRLKPAEFQGGGFTISNLGMFGIKEFAAIINPPQACILAVGAGEARPMVRDGALAVGTLMTCTLSVDHRVVDGAIGAEFLQAFKSLIEHPLAILV